MTEQGKKFVAYVMNNDELKTKLLNLITSEEAVETLKEKITEIAKENGFEIANEDLVEAYSTQLADLENITGGAGLFFDENENNRNGMCPSGPPSMRSENGMCPSGPPSMRSENGMCPSGIPSM